jgi:glycogen operon protein
MAPSPLVERITADPILAQSKFIAEPWDAAGLYQIGTFGRLGRWAEWNDHFRDDIRRFVKGDPGMVPRLASRLAGSPDIFGQQHGSPYCSINFVTCHDGFTLADLVTYNYKYNEMNGEQGRDGAHDNHSWNCGEEGPTTTPEVCGLRRRQMKNMMTLLFLAQGVPMLLSGDEMGRTQQGNNNAYCHDSALSWLDWNRRHIRRPLALCGTPYSLPQTPRRTTPAALSQQRYGASSSPDLARMSSGTARLVLGIPYPGRASPWWEG